MLSSGGKPAGGERVKVVIVETRYVRTDSEHFKSVVQTLTGKNSTLEAVVPEKPAISIVLGRRSGWAEGVVVRPHDDPPPPAPLLVTKNTNHELAPHQTILPHQFDPFAYFS